MLRFKSTDFIIVMLTGYFLVAYIVQIEEVRQSVPGAGVAPLFIIIVGNLYLLSRSVKRKPYGLFPGQLSSVYVYLFGLLSLLVLSNLNSLRPAYSIARVMVSVSVLGASFVFFWQALCVMDQSGMRKGRVVTFGLLGLLIILTIGQIAIPEWESGVAGIRMSGGSNPNEIAFFAFFAAFWAHYHALKVGGWGWDNISLFVLAIGVMAWSLSRSVLLSFIILYVAYFGIGLFGYLARIVRGRIPRSLLSNMVVGVGVFFSVLSMLSLLDQAIYLLWDLQVLEQRLGGGAGLETRLAGWKKLWPYFIEAPLTGRAGWWNSTNVLTESGLSNAVHSPHNLYVRILAEAGIIGALSVLVLPIVAVLARFRDIVCCSVFSNKYWVDAFIISSVTSMFVRQFFEDSYMTGFAGMGSGIMVFIIVCAIRG